MAVEGDVFFKKEVELEYEGHRLWFRVAQELFSSFDVDVGTRQLLRSLAQVAGADFDRVLDLGCGYGPIGIALRRAGVADEVDMVDRDALAVEYSRHNAELNEVENVQAFVGLGYDDVQHDDYGLIASNIPAKAGEPVIEHLLLEPRRYLRPGGLVAVVVIAPIAGFVWGVLDGSDEIEVVFTKASGGYTIFHYRFVGGDRGGGERLCGERGGGSVVDSVAAGVYRRGEATFEAGDLKYRLETAHGLPEFDSPSFQTRLLIDTLGGIDGDVGSAGVFGPGVGHVPIAVAKVASPERIELIDRDLLALRYSSRNLVLNGFPEGGIPLVHQVGMALPGEPVDLVAGVISSGEGPTVVDWMVREASRGLAPDGRMVVACSSTIAARLVRGVKRNGVLRVQKQRRKRGNRVLILTRA